LQPPYQGLQQEASTASKQGSEDAVKEEGIDGEENAEHNADTKQWTLENDEDDELEAEDDAAEGVITDLGAILAVLTLF
jgi:hypothetical protein